MNARSEQICKLQNSLKRRTAYITSKLGVVVPSQIKALRLQSNMLRQSDLAKAAEMHQSRISMFETPGAANVTLETLARIAAALKVGLIVKFVPFSEMLRWENNFCSDTFTVTKLDDDEAFLSPARPSKEAEIMAGYGESTPAQAKMIMVDPPEAKMRPDREMILAGSIPWVPFNRASERQA